MAQIRSIDTYSTIALTEWELSSVGAGQASDPQGLVSIDPPWTPAVVPGTAALALQRAGTWSVDQPHDFDADDWWYRCRFSLPDGADESPLTLSLEGLATLADVWLNGAHLLRSENMFHEHEVDVGPLVGNDNELLIRFASLRADLARRRPRPKWRTRLVADQKLRWYRTSLLGRMPGWSPPVAPVGPWKPVVLQQRRPVRVISASLRPSVNGTDGVVDVALELEAAESGEVSAAALRVGEGESKLIIESTGSRVRISGSLRVADVPLWWPHTHGSQPLFDVEVRLESSDEEIRVDLGDVGFRTIEVDDAAAGFALRVNGEPVFCRGACWSTAGIVTLAGDDGAYRATLRQARDAGMNMIRVGGTMTYEADGFYRACDELGLLVWQDFMFASMDYPADDEVFVASVSKEASQFLHRREANPCLALLCGGSEVEQQAAMLGMPPDVWSNSLFQETLPEIGRETRPDLPYVSSSPTGGEFPFRVDSGVAHYFGVGAYLRPLIDARDAGVRFASECLGFANIPDGPCIEAFMGGRAPVIHDPVWKERVPRDTGTGWDFEDIRDHYLGMLFGVDPPSLRYADPSRYLALSRVTTGEVMYSVFSEWRRHGSSCGGGLVWFFRDLWPGAGWGVVDALGTPKAAYYYLRRVLSPIVIVMTDEGVNGLRIHVINETDRPLEGLVDVQLLRHGSVQVGFGEVNIEVPARGSMRLDADRLIGRFSDAAYAYRFGPPSHDVVAASLRRAGEREPLGEAFHFPCGHALVPVDAGAVEADAAARDEGGYELRLSAKHFVQAMYVDVEGFVPDDNYFHVAPGIDKVVYLTPEGAPPARPRGFVEGLNLTGSVRIAFEEQPDGR